jgi:hypothetical protein
MKDALHEMLVAENAEYPKDRLGDYLEMQEGRYKCRQQRGGDSSLMPNNS